MIVSIDTEKEPRDQSWNELCEDEIIVLVWPEIAKKKFCDFVKTFDSD
jgi:hypothetical protein